MDARCGSKDEASSQGFANAPRIPFPTASAAAACRYNRDHASTADHIATLLRPDLPPLPWRPAPIIGDHRPFDPADAAHRPSGSAPAAPDAAALSEASLGFADPFHFDWPHW